MLLCLGFWKRLVLISCNSLFSSCNVTNINRQNVWHLWHKPLGHPHQEQLLVSLNNKFNSLTCSLSKSMILPFCVSNTRSSKPLEIHKDLWEPSPVIACLGYKYFVSFIGDFTRSTWIYFQHKKSEYSSLQNFSSYDWNQFSAFDLREEHQDQNFKFFWLILGFYFNPLLLLLNNKWSIWKEKWLYSECC